MNAVIEKNNLLDERRVQGKEKQDGTTNESFTATVTKAIMTGNPLVKIVVNDTSTISKLDARGIINL